MAPAVQNSSPAQQGAQVTMRSPENQREPASAWNSLKQKRQLAAKGFPEWPFSAISSANSTKSSALIRVGTPAANNVLFSSESMVLENPRVLLNTRGRYQFKHLRGMNQDTRGTDVPGFSRAGLPATVRTQISKARQRPDSQIHLWLAFSNAIENTTDNTC